MGKTNKRLLILTTVICLLPILLSTALYSQLPDQVAVHFNASGQADGFMQKEMAAFGLPVFMALINAFVHFKQNTDPKQIGISSTIMLISKWIVPIASITLVPISLYISLGFSLPVQTIVPIFVGLLLILCGNYLPKSRQNYTIGIKLPWTLNNEENWNKTHRMAGRLYVAIGFLMIITGFFKINNFALVLVEIILLTAAPFVYSYLLYRRQA